MTTPKSFDPRKLYAVQISFPGGGTYWPMQWGGLKHFTDQPAAATSYSLRGARCAAGKLRKMKPDIAELVEVVAHPHPTGGWLCR